MTGFYMKCNTGLKWINIEKISNLEKITKSSKIGLSMVSSVGQ